MQQEQVCQHSDAVVPEAAGPAPVRDVPTPYAVVQEDSSGFHSFRKARSVPVCDQRRSVSSLSGLPPGTHARREASMSGLIARYSRKPVETSITPGVHHAETIDHACDGQPLDTPRSDAEPSKAPGVCRAAIACP